MDKISLQNLADKYKPKPTKELTNYQLTIDEVNSVLETLLPDLATPNFKAWHCKAIYKLGPKDEMTSWRLDAPFLDRHTLITDQE